MSEAQVQQPQLLICSTSEQLERARKLFPRLESRYLNGGDWAEISGRRVVALGWATAAFAHGYAAETLVLPDDFPEDFGAETPIQWAKRVRVPYNETEQRGGRSHVSANAQDGSQELPDARKGPYENSESPPPDSAPQEPAPSPEQAGTGAQAPKVQEEVPPSDSPSPPAGLNLIHDAPESTQDAPEALESRPSGPGWLNPEAEDMGTPSDLWGQDDTLPILPVEAMPEAIAEYVADEAEVMGCDAGMLALYCIAICAGCTTDEIRLQVKSASDRWQESPRVWLMIVGDSGLTMKSPTLDAAVSHAWRIEREMRVNGGEALKAYELDRQIYESQKADYVKKRAGGNPAELPIEPPPPIAERLIVGNATLEAIGDVLLQQGERGVMVLADELLGIVSGMNQYKGGKGSDRTEWLEMWNGGPHAIDRKGRAVLVKNWGASIVGGTQPEAIARIGQNLETDGLLQRFTVYLPAYSGKGSDRAGRPEARRRYYNVLDRLAKLVASPDRVPVRFSPEAAAVMDEARTWVMETARGSWMPAGLRSHLAKWPAMLARYCLTYAAIEAADEHHAALPSAVSGRIARQVWTMMRGTLWAHAEHFYLNTLSRGTGNISAVRQLAGLILADGMEKISSRTMQQRSTLYRVAHATVRKEVISTLCELGWIHPIGGRSGITGLPTQYRVNPLVHERFPGVRERELAERNARSEAWDAARAAKAREPGED